MCFSIRIWNNIPLIIFILIVAIECTEAHRFSESLGTTEIGPLGTYQKPSCLTGYMTNIQRWVDEEGRLTSEIDVVNTIDLSAKTNVVPMLHHHIQIFRSSKTRSVRFLSLAKCQLTRVPTVFQLQDTKGRSISDMLEYLTLFGNEFSDISTPGVGYGISMNATDAIEVDADFIRRHQGVTSSWSIGFQRVKFLRLKQLDLRKCSIQILSENLFRGMPSLEALFLSENDITYISSNAFHGLRDLLHLDLSRNLIDEDTQLDFEDNQVFANLTNLVSLDLSYTRIMSRYSGILEYLGPHLERLSICHTGLSRLPECAFNGTSLKYLDVSGNMAILSGNNALCGTEGSLQVFYGDSIGLRTLDNFLKFEKLEILKLTYNEIALATPKVAKSLRNLQILDLTNNRIGTWFSSIFKYMPNLRLLSLRENNINLVTEDMVRDLYNVSFVALSGSFVVCNCHVREFFEIGLRNELITNHKNITSNFDSNSTFDFHVGFFDYNTAVANRQNLTKACRTHDCNVDISLDIDGNFLIIDYDLIAYQCLMVPEGRSVQFFDVQTCQVQRDIDFEEVIGESWNKLLTLIIIPCVLFPILIFTYVFRRNFKYFWITVKNSATLSLISKTDVIDGEGTIFNYDVFVSYCNEDRNWVLDYLLPHVEKDCNVSVCLHERDFQVGLSILENIVSCMDRSRSIMLIISQRFLLSQWCQFEMHLAQHRLLETRREDLILVLLEEIPRRLRPTTLHYLMLTKTYIVWPKETSEEAVFWKRLKKSLITHRLKQTENISLA